MSEKTLRLCAQFTLEVHVGQLHLLCTGYRRMGTHSSTRAESKTWAYFSPCIRHQGTLLTMKAMAKLFCSKSSLVSDTVEMEVAVKGAGCCCVLFQREMTFVPSQVLAECHFYFLLLSPPRIATFFTFVSIIKSETWQTVMNPRPGFSCDLPLCAKTKKNF